MESIRDFEKKAIEKHGWYAHYVFDDPTYPFSVNCHTHGLPQKYNHSDLQMCLPLSGETAHAIFWEVVTEIQKGKKFKAGDKTFEIIKDYPVTFIDAVELDRKVLRIIFPDPAGHIEKDDMDEKYKKQWKVISQN
jgi:hypothetical protein